MLIWDYIRDFLVQNIFGGTLSSGEFSYGTFLGVAGGNYDDYLFCNNLYFNVGFESDGVTPIPLSIGDWLSTTTTIIIMCLIVVLFALLVRWVFKTVVSAFLLR